MSQRRVPEGISVEFDIDDTAVAPITAIKVDQFGGNLNGLYAGDDWVYDSGSFETGEENTTISESTFKRYFQLSTLIDAGVSMFPSGFDIYFFGSDPTTETEFTLTAIAKWGGETFTQTRNTTLTGSERIDFGFDYNTFEWGEYTYYVGTPYITYNDTISMYLTVGTPGGGLPDAEFDEYYVRFDLNFLGFDPDGTIV